MTLASVGANNTSGSESHQVEAYTVAIMAAHVGLHL